jgi:hypothetical protein
MTLDLLTDLGRHDLDTITPSRNRYDMKIEKRSFSHIPITIRQIGETSFCDRQKSSNLGKFDFIFLSTCIRSDSTLSKVLVVMRHIVIMSYHSRK